MLSTIYYSYLKNWYQTWLASTRQSQTLRFMPQSGARGKNLGNFKSFLNLFFLSFIESYFVFVQQILFRTGVLCVAGP